MFAISIYASYTSIYIYIYIYLHVYIYIYMRLGWKFYELKSSLDDFIFVVDNLFDQWDPSTASLIQKMCRNYAENKYHLAILMVIS